MGILYSSSFELLLSHDSVPNAYGQGLLDVINPSAVFFRRRLHRMHSKLTGMKPITMAKKNDAQNVPMPFR